MVYGSDLGSFYFLIYYSMSKKELKGYAKLDKRNGKVTINNQLFGYIFDYIIEYECTFCKLKSLSPADCESCNMPRVVSNPSPL